MGHNEPGLTNADYAAWMSETASQDCALVALLEIEYFEGNTRKYANADEICEIMQSAQEDEIAMWNKVTFSGYDQEQHTWYAVDDRTSIHLERTENFASVPIKIRRPTGT